MLHNQVRGIGPLVPEKIFEGFHPLHLKPRSCAQFAPGCIFGHVNGVLEFAPRCRVQICSCLRVGANLFAPGCKLCT